MRMIIHKPSTPLSYLLALLFGLWLFNAHHGFKTLDVTYIDWLLVEESDITPDFFMWEYYRTSEWGWPIGKIENYSYPVVTSVGLSGAIPLIAIPLKSIRTILPDPFQYYGWWYLSCIILQLFFAIKLLKLSGMKNQLGLFIASCLFVLSPALLNRYDHANLCAHWIILANFYVFLVDTPVQKRIFMTNTLLAISLLVHPYLFVMQIAFTTALFADQILRRRTLSLSKTIAHQIGSITIILILWYSIGYDIIKGSDIEAFGFGYYSSNLNTFFNPMGHSTLIQGLPNKFDGQYEGFAYMGSGILLLAIIVSVLSILKRKRPSANNWILTLICILLFLFSLSNIITFNDTTLFQFGLTPFAERIGSILRASGRYVWPLYYLLVYLIVTTLFKQSKRKWASFSLLFLALVIQIIDLKPLTAKAYPLKDHTSRLVSDVWDDLYSEAELVMLYPPFEWRYIYGDRCMDFIQKAHEYRLPISNGHLPRTDEIAKQNFLLSFHDYLDGANSKFDKTLIISHRNQLYFFEKYISAGLLRCYSLDGFQVLIPSVNSDMLEVMTNHNIEEGIPGEKIHLTDFLERNKATKIILSVRDEGTQGLDSLTRSYFKERGSLIDSLSYRGSYIAIISNDSIKLEMIDNQESLYFKDGQLEIFSAGKEAGDSVSISYDGREYATGRRGFNIVTIDRNNSINPGVQFDTYLRSWHFNWHSENLK